MKVEARMAYAFEFDAKNRVLLFRFTERVSEQRIGQFYEEASAQIELMQPRAAIFDFTGVTCFDVSTDSIRDLADSPPLIPEAACPRVVVAPAAHIFAMSRMFQILGGSSRPSFQVVRSMAEAAEAIQIQSLDFQPLNHKVS